MKIRIVLESNTDFKKTVSPEDLETTIGEWNKMSEDQKKSLVREYADGLMEQPYWEVESFNVVEF